MDVQDAPDVASSLGVEIRSDRDKAIVRGWQRVIGGSRRALKALIASAVRDASEAMARSKTLEEIAPWVEAALQDGSADAPPADTAEWRRTPASVRHWVMTARPGALLTYHVGQLSVDRQRNPVLNATADYLSALEHLGAVRLVMARTSLAACSVYCASRCGGFRHHPLLLGMISALEYRALAAATTRPINTALRKHLESQIPCSPDVARQVEAAIVRAGWVARNSGGGRGALGVEVTPAGKAMLDRRPYIRRANA